MVQHYPVKSIKSVKSAVYIQDQDLNLFMNKRKYKEQELKSNREYLE